MTLQQLHESRRSTHRVYAIAVSLALCLASVLLPTPSLGLQVLIASAAVAIFGVPHGAFDALVAVRDGTGTQKRAFLIGYALIAGVTVLLWLLSPVASLCLFLLLSIVHFGRGDLADSNGESRDPVEVLVRGSIPIVLPAALHPEPVAQVFAWLCAMPPASVEPLVSSLAPWLAGALGLVAAIQLVRMRSELGSRSLAALAELPVLLIVFAVLPPLLSFALYFSVWHSARHLIALDTLLHRRAGLRRSIIARAGLPIVAVTLAGGAAIYPLLSRQAVDLQAALQVVFIGLAALTVPHMAVTLKVDRDLAGST